MNACKSSSIVVMICELNNNCGLFILSLGVLCVNALACPHIVKHYPQVFIVDSNGFRNQNFLSRNGLDVFFLGRVFHFDEGFLEFPFLLIFF
jgi:hypothetical protein